MANRTLLGRIEDFEELRMQGRFATGNLHDIGLALVGDHGIEHALDRGEVAKAGTMRSRIGVADRAAQIAEIGDLDQRQATVLHVLWTQAAIVGTAPA